MWRFPTIGVPLVLIHFHRMFHYKPSIWGYPHCRIPYIYIYICDIYIYIQCEAPKMSKLVYNSNNYGLW